VFTLSTCTDPSQLVTLLPVSSANPGQITEILNDDGTGGFAKLLDQMLNEGQPAAEIAEDVVENEDAAAAGKNPLPVKIEGKKSENSVKTDIVADNGSRKPENKVPAYEASEEDYIAVLSAEMFLSLPDEQIIQNSDGIAEEEFLDVDAAASVFENEYIGAASFDALPVSAAESFDEAAGFEEFSEKTALHAVTEQKPLWEESAAKISLDKPANDAALAPVWPETANLRNEELAGAGKKIPEKEGKSRLDDVRRRDRLSVDVRDFRSGQTGAENKFLANSSVRQGGENIREITLELRLPHQGQNTAQTETLWEAKANRAGVAFDDLLARELHQNFNGDIVRHASMALRDGGQSTIRLALKPEALGNVKIRLEMTENKITGHIVVETEDALNAFRREIQSLEQAFRDSGFDNADLNLSLAADGREAEQAWQEPGDFASRAAALSYEAAFEQVTPAETAFYGRELSSINVLA